MQAGQDRQESAASEQVCGTPVQESSVNDSAMTSHDKGHEKNENGKSSAEQGGACEQDRDDEDENEGKGEGGEGESRAEDELARLALAFFTATTKSSTDNEDILPQEDSDMMKLSVFNIFASLFPEAVGEHGAGVKNKRLRLHFNKIGYQIYSKEQSRRVPAVRAKPGNPGYGFRRARWRDTTQLESDRQHCIQVLREVGCSEERISAVLDKVQGTCLVWDSIRRPSRPAGPGRPRRPEDASATSPVLNTASPKQVAWVAKCPKTGPSKKPQSASEKRVCDFKGLDSKGGKGGAPSAPGAAAPRASTCAKSKARGSTGGKARKEGAELLDETVPNLVKDETSESEVLSNSARGMSQSPHFSFSPLDPGTRIAGCGSQSTHTNYKTTNYKTCNGLSTAEHSSEGAGRNANGVGHGGPQTTTTMPTGTKRGFKGSEQGHGAERAKRVKISATSSGANVEVPPADAPQVECAISVSSVSSSAHECPVGYQEDDRWQLPPLKLGDAIIACAASDPRRVLPPFAHINAHSFSGLEKLASLASSSEKLVAASRSAPLSLTQRQD